MPLCIPCTVHQLGVLCFTQCSYSTWQWQCMSIGLHKSRAVFSRQSVCYTVCVCVCVCVVCVFVCVRVYMHCSYYPLHCCRVPLGSALPSAISLELTLPTRSRNSIETAALLTHQQLQHCTVYNYTIYIMDTPNLGRLCVL